MKTILLMLIVILLISLIFNTQWFLKIIYPQFHKELINEVSSDYNIDPYLVMAIMRVESKYNTKAESQKGARGLMQVMPETGRWISTELKFNSFEPDMLFEPEYNIKIGIFYLNYLQRVFDGKIVPAIAAYNAGETNVKKWIKKGTWDGSMQELSKIPFPETKNYVYRVIMSYKTYKDLYK